MKKSILYGMAIMSCGTGSLFGMFGWFARDLKAPTEVEVKDNDGNVTKKHFLSPHELEMKFLGDKQIALEKVSQNGKTAAFIEKMRKMEKVAEKASLVDMLKKYVERISKDDKKIEIKDVQTGKIKQIIQGSEEVKLKDLKKTISTDREFYFKKLCHEKIMLERHLQNTVKLRDEMQNAFKDLINSTICFEEPIEHIDSKSGLVQYLDCAVEKISYNLKHRTYKLSDEIYAVYATKIHALLNNKDIKKYKKNGYRKSVESFYKELDNTFDLIKSAYKKGILSLFQYALLCYKISGFEVSDFDLNACYILIKQSAEDKKKKLYKTESYDIDSYIQYKASLKSARKYLERKELLEFAVLNKPELVAQRAQELLADRTKRLEQETEIAKAYLERNEQLRYGCTLDSITH